MATLVNAHGMDGWMGSWWVGLLVGGMDAVYIYQWQQQLIEVRDALHVLLLLFNGSGRRRDVTLQWQ